MKRQLRYIFASFSFILCLTSCLRDPIVAPERFYEGDGRIVNVSAQFATPDMKVQTKANDLVESHVDNIYIFAFKISEGVDEKQFPVSNEKRYFSGDELLPATPQVDHDNAGCVELNVPTGTYYIVAVANVGGDINSSVLKPKLDSVKTYGQFLEITAELTNGNNVSRSYMTMSGNYVESLMDAQKHGFSPQPAVIRANGMLSGYIHLRRFDTYINMSVGIHDDLKADLINFRVKTWQVINLPKSTRVVEGDKSCGLVYSSTQKFNAPVPVGSGADAVYNMGFYMFENKGVSLHAIDNIKLREAEEKNPDGKNPGVPSYINAPDSSTYVVIEAAFQQWEYETPGEESSKFLRDVNAQYIIHLGYCDEVASSDGSSQKHIANDFSIDRNTKYYYNILIKGADDIVMEAKKEEGQYNNGVEGTVIDLKGGEFFDLDAHYSVFNVVLTPGEIASMHLYITSPLGTWSSVGTTPSDPSYPDRYTEDYQHIRIAYNEAGTIEYKANSAAGISAVNSLVSYTETYDYDFTSSTSHTELNDTYLIPMHHEHKQKQDEAHTVPIYDLISFKNAFGVSSFMDSKIMRIQELTNKRYIITPNTPLVFTVFVNEFYYFYENGEISKNETYDENGRIVNERKPDYTMWKNYVNNPSGRTYMLLAKTEDSTDGDSHHLEGKIQIHQRAIETYFGEHVLDGYTKDSPEIPSALGLEQINEHHYKNLAGYFWRENAGTKTNHDYEEGVGGWHHTYLWLTGQKNSHRAIKDGKANNSWDTHVDQKTVMGYNDVSPDNTSRRYNTFRSRTVQEIFTGTTTAYNYKQTLGALDENHELIDAVAVRNRDLNRDGLIGKAEIRWFAPSSSEYVTFAVGAGALQTPLFDKTQFNPAQSYWDSNGDLSGKWLPGYHNVYYNGIFHFLGTDSRYVVSEEGTSVGESDYNGGSIGITGNWATAYYTQFSSEMRAARYLGVQTGDQGYDNIELPDPASFNPENYVITTIKYASNVRRAPVDGRLLPHSNLDYGPTGSNRLPDYFQVARRNASQDESGVVHGAKITDDPATGRNPMQVLNDRLAERGNYYCRNYSESPDGSDLGTWRVPNFMELSMMYNYMPASIMDFGLDAGPDRPRLLTCTYWYRNEELTSNYETSRIIKNWGSTPLYRHYLGGRGEMSNGQYVRKLSLLASNTLYNEKYHDVRCVRDTDKDGNYVGRPEYGNPVDFTYGTLSATYNSDGTANYSVNSTITNQANVASVTVSIDGVMASSPSVSGDTYAATLIGKPVASQAYVTWTITTRDGKTLNYSRYYPLPARYWMISYHALPTRYVTVNTENNRTYVGANDTRNVDLIDDVYKWIITRNPSGTDPVNEFDLQENVTYYLFNAGTRQYISGPTGGTYTYMTVGGTPMTMKLIKQPNGYYVLRFNDATNANKNGGDSNFGTWTGTGTGNHYILTPAVMRGPMTFIFDQNISIEDVSDSRKRYTVHVETSPEAVIESVTIGDYTATVTGSNGDFYATVECNTIKSNSVTTEWQFTYNGESITRSHQYNLPTPYYVISNVTYPHRYAWSDYGNDSRTTVDPSDILANPDNLETKYKWIVTTTPVAVGEPENVSNFVSGTTYYLYNVAARKYVSGPRRAENYLEFGDYSQALPCNMEVRDNGASYSVHFIGSGAYNANACIGAYSTTGTNPNYGCFGMFDTSNRNSAIAKYVFTPAFERGMESFGVSLGSEIGTDLGYKYVVLDLATVDGVSSVTATINGVNANVALNGTRAIAFNDELEKDRAEVVWDVVYRGSVFQYTKIYVKLSGYWTFTHGDHYDWYVVPVASGNAYITNIVQRSSMPEDAKWILALKSNPTTCITQWRANETEEYVLYNLSVGQYLSAPLSGNLDMALTGSVNNAVVFVIKYGGDGVRPCLHFKNADGSGWIGWAEYRDSNGAKHVGTDSGLHHAWHLDYHAE